MAKNIFPAFLSCQGPHLSDAEKYLFAEKNPLGVCLFSRFCENVKNKEQLAQLTKEIKETIGRENVLIAIDQEGGRVRRLLEPEFTPVAEQKRLTTEDMVANHAYLVSRDLKSVGINVNFAPVLDVEYPNTSAVLHGRCFSGNEMQIAKLGKKMVSEYVRCGICPCIKHLPGHGRGTVDPHLELPVVTADLNDLDIDFYPFWILNNAPMGMVAHLILQCVDPENPASKSSKVIQQIIRKQIGFSGLLVSDAIVMNALKGSITDRAKDILSAGCDVICLGNTDYKTNEELCSLNLTLTDEAKERLDKIYPIFEKKPDFADYEYIKKNYCLALKDIISYDYNYDATEVLNRLHKTNGDF